MGQCVSHQEAGVVETRTDAEDVPQKITESERRERQKPSLEVQHVRNASCFENETAILSIPFFDNMDAKNLKRLRELFDRTCFQPGERVVEEGSENRYFHIIVSGTVVITARSPTGDIVELEELGPGNWFGDSALVGEGLIPITVLARTETTVLCLSRVQFREFADECGLSVTLKNISEQIPLQVTLQKLPFFSEVPIDKLQMLGSMFHFRRADEGQVICRQDEDADGFYIIVRGRVDCSAVPPGHPDAQAIHLCTLTEGDWFGETALLQRCKRTATIRTLQRTVFLHLDADAFRRFLRVAPEVRESSVFQRVTRQRTANSLKTIPLFNIYKQKEIGPLRTFDEDKLTMLGELFTFVTFSRGQTIMRQGDKGDAFFIIVRGQVSISSWSPVGAEEVAAARASMTKEVELGYLGENEWFGEIALIKDTRRMATVRAHSPEVTLLKLTSDNFQRFLELSPELKGRIEKLIGVRTADVLEKVPFFKGVKENKPWSKLGLLGALFVFEHRKKGEEVIRQGERGEKFFLIVEGECDVLVTRSQKEFNLETLGPNAWFGEIALLYDTPRTASIRCRSPCMFLTLTSDKFRKFLSIAPELSSSFTALISHRTANVLSTLDFFSAIKENKPWSKLELLGTLLRYESVPADSTVVHMDEQGDKFYLIVQGRCMAKARNRKGRMVVLEILEKGSYFGEIALLKECRRTASIITLEPCVFLTLTRNAFHKFLHVCPELQPSIEEVVQKRHWVLSVNNVQFGTPPPTSAEPRSASGPPSPERKSILLPGHQRSHSNPPSPVHNLLIPSVDEFRRPQRLAPHSSDVFLEREQLDEDDEKEVNPLHIDVEFDFPPHEQDAAEEDEKEEQGEQEPEEEHIIFKTLIDQTPDIDDQSDSDSEYNQPEAVAAPDSTSVNTNSRH